MLAPHVVWIECARAKRDHFRAECSTVRGNHVQGLEPGIALSRIGMNDVECARDGSYFEPALLNRAGDAFHDGGVELLRKTGQTGTSVIELDAAQTMRHDRIERLLDS